LIALYSQSLRNKEKKKKDIIMKKKKEPGGCPTFILKEHKIGGG
jgi:hypothetical protein